MMNNTSPHPSAKLRRSNTTKFKIRIIPGRVQYPGTRVPGYPVLYTQHSTGYKIQKIITHHHDT